MCGLGSRLGREKKGSQVFLGMTKKKSWCITASFRHPPPAASSIQIPSYHYFWESGPLNILFSGSHTTVRCVKCLIELKRGYDEAGEEVMYSF